MQPALHARARARTACSTPLPVSTLVSVLLPATGLPPAASSGSVCGAPAGANLNSAAWFLDAYGEPAMTGPLVLTSRWKLRRRRRGGALSALQLRRCTRARRTA